MCTVTFLPLSETSYFFTSNRDEQKIRPAATLPEMKTGSNGAAFLSPTDTQAGGTWIGLTKKGVSFSLLNRYYSNETQADPENAVSRGTIIPLLAGVECEHETHSILQEHDPRRFNPFTLVGVFQNPLRTVRWDWNGRSLTKEDVQKGPRIWVSSGYDQGKSEKIRREFFERELAKYRDMGKTFDLNLVKKIHTSEFPEKGPIAISMVYDHVQSVSGTIIQHTAEPGMYYHDGKPEPSGEWIFTPLR